MKNKISGYSKILILILLQAIFYSVVTAESMKATPKISPTTPSTVKIVEDRVEAETKAITEKKSIAPKNIKSVSSTEKLEDLLIIEEQKIEELESSRKEEEERVRAERLNYLENKAILIEEEAKKATERYKEILDVNQKIVAKMITLIATVGVLIVVLLGAWIKASRRKSKIIHEAYNEKFRELVKELNKKQLELDWKLASFEPIKNNVEDVAEMGEIASTGKEMNFNAELTKTLRIKDAHETLEALKKLDKKYPKLSSENRELLYFKIAVVSDYAGDYESALEYNNKVLKKNPFNVDSYFNRGNAKIKVGQFEEAVLDYNKVIELNPKYPVTYNNRGIAKNNLGKYEEAIADYDQAIEINPEYVEAYNNRAGAKMSLGRIEEAIVDYTVAIKKKPDYLEALFNRAGANMKLFKFEEAVKDYGDLTLIKPDYVDFQVCHSFSNFLYGEHLIFNGDKEKSLEKLQDALKTTKSILEKIPNYVITEINVTLIKSLIAEITGKREDIERCVAKYSDILDKKAEDLGLENKVDIYFYRGIAKEFLEKDSGKEDLDEAIKSIPELQVKLDNYKKIM